MTARQINAITRDGGNGSNVYVRLDPCGTGIRVTRARTREGRVQVRSLHTGAWLDVTARARVFVSL